MCVRVRVRKGRRRSFTGSFDEATVMHAVQIRLAFVHTPLYNNIKYNRVSTGIAQHVRLYYITVRVPIEKRIEKPRSYLLYLQRQSDTTITLPIYTILGDASS